RAGRSSSGSSGRRSSFESERREPPRGHVLCLVPPSCEPCLVLAKAETELLLERLELIEHLLVKALALRGELVRQLFAQPPALGRCHAGLLRCCLALYLADRSVACPAPVRNRSERYRFVGPAARSGWQRDGNPRHSTVVEM